MLVNKEKYCLTYNKVLLGDFEITRPIFKNIKYTDAILSSPPIGNVTLDKYFNKSIWMSIPLGYTFGLIKFMEIYDSIGCDENILKNYFLALIFNNEETGHFYVDTRIEKMCMKVICDGVKKDMELINDEKHLKERKELILEYKDLIPEDFYIFKS